MSNPKPARPAIPSPSPAPIPASPEVGLGVASANSTDIQSNDTPRSRTVVENNDAVQTEVMVVVDSEVRELNGTVIETFVGVQPGIAFADVPAEEVAAVDATAAAIAAFAEQED